MNIQKNNLKQGYLAIFFSCLASAGSLVFLADMNRTHNPYLSVAITFIFTILLFHLLCANKISELYKKVASNFILIGKMNFFTLANWLSSILALRYLHPSTVLCVDFSVAALTVFLIQTPLQSYKDQRNRVLCLALIFFSMWLVIKQYSLGTNDTKAIWISLAWCAISGISAAYIGFCSEAMGDAKFSIKEILATRFYLLIIVCSVAFFAIDHTANLHINWLYYLLSTTVIVVIPLFAYQLSIKCLGTATVSFIEPVTPVLTYFLEVLVTHEQPFAKTTVGVLALTSCLLVWLAAIERKS